ncbi:MAG: hypothetical protein PHQ23_12550 [Candidatus Wallbacteria bacterium]|nr:hypothetical protein [Candidatus Wallbacteria bacterium]
MGNKGNTLLIVFIIISVLTFLGISFNMLVSTDISISQSKGNYIATEYLAQAGAEIAIHRQACNPELTANHLSYLRGCTIEVTQGSCAIGYDPRNAIGGRYPLLNPTEVFRFGPGMRQEVTVNLGQEIQLSYLSSYHNPDTLGSQFIVETKLKNESTWRRWIIMNNPKGQILIASSDTPVSIQLVRFSYGEQIQNSQGVVTPTEVIELFGMKKYNGLSNGNFSLILDGFTDYDPATGITGRVRKTFIKYDIQGNRIIATARLMEKNELSFWETKSLANYQLLTVFINNELSVLFKNFTEEYLPLVSSNEVEKSMLLSSGM